MKPLARTFSLRDLPEVFPTSTAISEPLQRAVRAGRARKLAGRLYTRNLDEPLEQVARRNWQAIVAHRFPGAVVADRSAFEAKPSGDGSIFLDAGPAYTARRPVRLPGLTLWPRPGPGPVGGDMPFMGDLHFSGPARKFLDNLRPSRARGGALARTLSRVEIEDELVRVAALRGTEALDELRDQAREVAPSLDAARELKLLDDLIGAIRGTGELPLATAAARAQRQGLGFDPRRLELFEALQAQLLQTPQPQRPERPGSQRALPFFEAYFSNWIEGTEFAVDEAEEIVFTGEIPEGRFEDAHDVLGTFEIVGDPDKQAQAPGDPEDLIRMLRSHHAQMLGRRPTAHPGSFKAQPNQAGGTTFVHPDLVEGTLVEGFRYFEPLPPGLARATFMMFLVAEVHPFTDGNGRVARVLMNAELTAAGQQRIVIPLPYRDNYLQGLRALSRNGNPRPLVRVLDFAQRYAAAIDWSDLETAKAALAETNAFVPPDVAEERNLKLQLPPDAGP